MLLARMRYPIAALLLLSLPGPCLAGWPRVLDATGQPASLEAHFGARRRILAFAGLGTLAETAMLDAVNANLKHVRRRKDTTLGVVFVGMSHRQAERYCREHDYRFPWFCDPDGRVLPAFELDFLPALLVLSPADEVLFRTTALPAELVKSVLKHPDRPPGDAALRAGRKAPPVASSLGAGPSGLPSGSTPGTPGGLLDRSTGPAR